MFSITMGMHVPTLFVYVFSVEKQSISAPCLLLQLQMDHSGCSPWCRQGSHLSVFLSFTTFSEHCFHIIFISIMLFNDHNVLVGVPNRTHVIDEETGSEGFNDWPNVTWLIMKWTLDVTLFFN